MFRLISRESQARAGELSVNGRVIKTPFFMPVATKGSVKYMNSKLLQNAGIQCIISNSLIFSWSPGLEVIRKAGGLHKFINWEGGIFTDSGGFQSLDENMLIGTTSEFAKFKSPFDGRIYEISPEKAMQIQHQLGSDIAMCLDEVPMHNDSYRTVRSKTLRTHSWARRCKEYHDKLDKDKKNQLLFGIAQGGNFVEMREKSIEFLSKLGFDGIAQGGLAIGEPVEKMYEALEKTCRLMPENTIRYVMGVGNPKDVIESIAYGADCFDSTFPTQNARHGTLFTMRGRLRIVNSKYKNDHLPIERECNCFTCKNYSRAFVRHQLKHREGVGLELATIHNITFMQRFMKKIRDAIRDKRFETFRKQVLNWN
ncbi:MAG: tRNA guanosine(34) transglycosylase Tgt [Candidatus Nanoarchaeia archaeon]